MALVLNATPLSPACNSYATLAVALEYVTTRVPNLATAAAWIALTDAQKSMYLVNASRTLDSLSKWIGEKYTRDQGLYWPRGAAVVDGFLLDSTVFPPVIVQATIEFALWQLSNDGAVSIGTNAQYNAIRVGPIAIDFNAGAGIRSTEYFPDIVSLLLKEYGGITNPDLPSSRALRQVKLVRA